SGRARPRAACCRGRQRPHPYRQLFGLVELPVDQLLDRLDRGGLVLAVGADGDDRSFSSGQEENAEDRLGVDVLVALADLDVRLETRRDVHELRRRACMEAELVLDLDVFGDHCVVTDSKSDATRMAFEPFSVITCASVVTSRASCCMVPNLTIIG